MTATEPIPQLGDSADVPDSRGGGSDWRRRNYLAHLAADLEYDLCLGEDELADAPPAGYGRNSNFVG